MRALFAHLLNGFLTVLGKVCLKLCEEIFAKLIARSLWASRTVSTPLRAGFERASNLAHFICSSICIFGLCFGHRRILHGYAVMTE